MMMSKSAMQSITPFALKTAIDNQEAITLIDVREFEEHQQFHIGGQLIPLNTIFENIDVFKNAGQVVVYCEKGIRSQIAIQRLEMKFGLTHLINLKGGMAAWKKQYPL